MNFNSLRLWDYGAGDESVDNKITTGAEVGGLLPGLEFALKSAINLSKSSLTNQRLVIYLLLIFLQMSGRQNSKDNPLKFLPLGSSIKC